MPQDSLLVLAREVSKGSKEVCDIGEACPLADRRQIEHDQPTVLGPSDLLGRKFAVGECLRQSLVEPGCFAVRIYQARWSALWPGSADLVESWGEELLEL